MALPDRRKIWPKLEAAGEDEVRRKLACKAFAAFKIPVIEDWLMQKDSPTVMYHEFDAPQGRTFRAGEVPKLESGGWVDTPAKFGKRFRFRARRGWRTVRSFFRQEWKWIITTVVAVTAVILTKCTG